MVFIADTEDIKEKPVKQSQGNGLKFWAFLIGGFIIGFLWLMVLTNLPSMPIFNIADVPKFQADIRNVVFLITIFYFIALVADYWVKDKYNQWANRETSSIKIMESHLLIPKIREYAFLHYNLKLGDCMKIQGLMPHKEAGSIPTTRFFLFENVELNETGSYSIWVVNYVKIINIHLFKRFHVGSRDSNHKYWTGESRNEVHQSIAETTAGKRGKDIKNVSPEDEDNSMTEES